MMMEKTILRVVIKLLVPLIVLYAFYVQFHGDFGPGGGFQAGVIFASAFIVHALIFGVGVTRKILPPAVTRTLLATGVLVYSGTGVAALLMGGEFLDYSFLAHDALHGQHLGIFLVEFGVCMTVSGAMTTIFFTFAGHVKEAGEEDAGDREL